VIAPVRPGTILVTRSEGGILTGGWWIRLGAAIQGKPNLANHVAVAHHTDKAGTLWCLEGKPGGVGWRDARGYLASRWTMTNAEQPLDDGQRVVICETMEAMLGTEYDWQSIVADGAADLGMRLPGWDARWKGEVAGQVVCSSAAAYAYAKAHAPHPPGDRGCQPADWSQWILTRAWAGPPPPRTARL
jgi:hypothetical protein